ncbi:MAG: Holliday junction branch migration protein RuvA [Acutalibacteraceae bacterium]|nr:Holliday junction branch migration protein RuvA [Acutalibacteraceae bacterium]
MISSLRGRLIYSEKDYIIVECGGVGFKCNVSLNTIGKLPKLNSDIFIYTFMSVKEDAIDLFGFFSLEEIDCFKLLLSVSGVGPKMAIALLSEFTADRIMLLIASGDAKSLTAASGVGNKLAQRIVLELKDKVGTTFNVANVGDIAAVGNASAATNSKEAISALVSLGFSQSDAAMAVSKFDSSLSTEELIKLSLKELSRQV